MDLSLSADIFSQLPGEIAWKNTQLQYLGCNRNRASAAQLNYPEEIIGLMDTDLVDQTIESISFHRAHDELALQGETVRTIQLSPARNDGTAYFQIKKPLYVNGEIKGVLYHTNEFMQQRWFNDLRDIDKKYFPAFYLLSYYQINADANIYRFSKRELEVVFCMLRGMSAKQTGDLIGLSKRTIETYVDNIKNKLGCSTKVEMIVRTIDAGYIQIVPERFLTIDWTRL